LKEGDTIASVARLAAKALAPAVAEGGNGQSVPEGAVVPVAAGSNGSDVPGQG
jgi:hypothetical protein